MCVRHSILESKSKMLHRIMFIFLFKIIEAVNTFPLSIDPEILGLNKNVLFRYYDNLVNLLLTDMIKLYPNSNTINGENNNCNEIVRNTAKDILKSLPELFNIQKVKTFYGDRCATPNIIVLLRELEQFNALLAVMKNSLSQLIMVIQFRIFIYALMNNLPFRNNSQFIFYKGVPRKSGNELYVRRNFNQFVRWSRSNFLD